MTHYRVDRELSNTYEVWKDGVAAGAVEAAAGGARKSGALQGPWPPRSAAATQGKIVVTFALATAGVSLVKLTW